MIRFYLTLNGPETGDVSFAWTDFQNRVNADLIGNLGNFWNRTFSMTSRYLRTIPSMMCQALESQELLQKAKEAFGTIGGFIEKSEFRQALRLILELSAAANVYINQREPWKYHESNPPHTAETLGVCCAVADTLRRLSEPFLPHAVQQLNNYLGAFDKKWTFSPLPLGYPINPPTILFKKIDPELIQVELSQTS